MVSKDELLYKHALIAQKCEQTSFSHLALASGFLSELTLVVNVIQVLVIGHLCWIISDHVWLFLRTPLTVPQF